MTEDEIREQRRAELNDSLDAYNNEWRAFEDQTRTEPKKLCQYKDGVCTQCHFPLAANQRRMCRPGVPPRNLPVRESGKPKIASSTPPKTPCGGCGGGKVAKREPKKLGDTVESVFAGMGITKERYREAKALFGLPPNCACDARKEWLNRVSDWWRGETKPTRWCDSGPDPANVNCKYCGHFVPLNTRQKCRVQP
jgi:hypothetical protein